MTMLLTIGTSVASISGGQVERRRSTATSCRYFEG